MRVTEADMSAGAAKLDLLNGVLIPGSAPIDKAAAEDECVHVVESGDTLFNIGQVTWRPLS